MKLYRLVELEWREKGMRGQPVTQYGTDTVLGEIDVEQNEKSKRWRYSWSFTEYYDEGKSDKTYKTAEEAKAAAWEFYLGRIGVAVQEVYIRVPRLAHLEGVQDTYEVEDAK